MTAFMRTIEDTYAVPAFDYRALHDFSLANPDAFWRSVWTFTGIRGDIGEHVVADYDRMPGAQFFPEARLNFAENLLRRTDDDAAIVFNGENRVHRTMSARELRREVARFAAALRLHGVSVGDRVAGFVPNLPEAVVAALAAAAIGAVWSSCSPDFGVQGVIDRFGQIEPAILVAADGYFYAGKT